MPCRCVLLHSAVLQHQGLARQPNLVSNFAAVKPYQSWVRTYKFAVENQEAFILRIALLELARMKN